MKRFRTADERIGSIFFQEKFFLFAVRTSLLILLVGTVAWVAKLRSKKKFTEVSATVWSPKKEK
jgi:hypothetical protein